MKGILDDTKLEGVADVSTSLRPHRIAELLPAGDLDTLLHRIAFNCEAWGGGGTVLVPSTNGQLTEPYRSMLVASDVDRIESAIPGHEYKPPRWLSNGMGRRHPVLLIVNGMKERKEWLPFRVADLERDDPWWPIYAATLGVWPATPSSEIFPTPFYREAPESFEMFFKVERERTSGSLDDLVERLTGDNTNYPRGLTTVHLAQGLLPDTSFLGGGSVFPQRNATRRAAGPNVVVVFSDDPVADGALLWNLRGAHTREYALPIGVPHSEVNAESLAMLQQPGNAAMFGLGGGKIYLTSTSVQLEELNRLAGEHPGAVVAPWEHLLALGPAPSIPRTQIATFDDGRARLVPLTDRDHEAIYPFGRSGMTPSLQLAISVDRDPVPVSRTLRGDGMTGSHFAAGSAQVSVSSSSAQGRTTEVEWPTGWLRLQCVARDLGLDVEVSPPGRAALALLEAIGGVGQVYWLCHPDLVNLFYRLAERSGMTWWKQRWTKTKQELMSQGVDEAAIEEVAERLGRDAPTITPPGEGRELGFQEFVKALGGNAKAAENWIKWAEPRHLVVRGAKVRCNNCSASSWLPMSAIPSVITCTGCGRVVEQPFPARQLEFRYRIGEVLRRALEVDCLDHLFALRYFDRLLDRQGLVGAHPGVNFRERGSSAVAAEADVVLLFADGSLVPGEVKRTGAGVTPGEIEKLSNVVDRLGAPWSFLAVGQAASDCGANVPAAESRASDQLRFVVTTDQTYASHAFLSLGADPFIWKPDPVLPAQRAATFVSSLEQRSPEEPWSMQEVIYLEREDPTDTDDVETGEGGTPGDD